MGRRLPLADTALVDAIQAQQAWVANRFPHTPPSETVAAAAAEPETSTGPAISTRTSSAPGCGPGSIASPASTPACSTDNGEPVPFDRDAIHPHAFRHTYAQTLADQGVPAPVLRDLMDHRSIDTSLGYYKVARRQEARRHGAPRPPHRQQPRRHPHHCGASPPASPTCASSSAGWRSRWASAPSRPTSKQAGRACPIRYQCAGCPHFESDPSYLPELRAYADQLRREREAMIAVGAAEWVVANVAGQLEVITGHIRHHEKRPRAPSPQRTSPH